MATVTSVTDKMAETALGDVSFLAKKVAGTKGVSTDVKTNLSLMSIKPNIPYYKYDVRMYVDFDRNGKLSSKELTKQTREDYPEQIRKESTVKIFKKLTKIESSFFGKSRTVYDRASILFSTLALKLDGEEKCFTLNPDFIPGFEEASAIRVVIKKVTEGYQVSTNDLAKVHSQRAGQEDKGIMEVLNLLCGQSALMDSDKFITYGNGMHYCWDPISLGFKTSDFPALPDGKYMGGGAHKSVKILEGTTKGTPSAFVVTEIKKTAFHADEINLLDKIKAFSLFSGRGFTVEAANSSNKMIRDQLKGLYVETTYGKKQCFPIVGLAEAANQKKMKLATGDVVTVEQYFGKKYGVKLKYPSLFMVQTRPNRAHAAEDYPCYPVELLIVGKSQRVVASQQTPDQNQITIKACATLPAERLRQTEVMKKGLGLVSENLILKEAGITISPDMTVVPARILAPPTLTFSEKKTVRPQDNCKWNSDNTKFIYPASIGKWAVFGLFVGRDAQYFQFDKYITELGKMMMSKGMKVPPPVVKQVINNARLEDVKAVMAKAKNNGLNLVFFISSDNIKLHEHIKLLEVETQIVTQEVRVSKANGVLEKGQFQTLENVVQKTNQKLGGFNNTVTLSEPGLTDLVQVESRCFIGFEISHPAPLSQAEISRGVAYKMPSVIGWGANCGKQHQYFIGDYHYTQPRQSDMLGGALRMLIQRILLLFKKNRGKPATHLVIYFNGVSEGQWKLIASDYLSQINLGIKDISPNYKPMITSIATTKEHNERLYKKVINGVKASDQNIAPGTVVDSVITNPVLNEFYLNAHSAFQGTAKTPKYAVLSDSFKPAMTMDAYEAITHALCYMHGIVNMTVSLPAPLMVANRCSKRGHNVYITAEGNSTNAAALNIETANAELTNSGKPLEAVRYNA